MFKVSLKLFIQQVRPTVQQAALVVAWSSLPQIGRPRDQGSTAAPGVGPGVALAPEVTPRRPLA